MNTRTIIDLFCMACIPLLILGLYLGLPVFLPCILLLFLRLAICNLDTAGVFLVMFGGPVGGLVRAMYPSVPLYGMMLVAAGVCLLAVRFKGLKLRPWLYLLALYLLFGITWLYGPRSTYASEKMLNICLNGTLFLLAFRAIAVTKSMSARALGELLILTALAMISFSIIYYGFSGPESWLDFKWLRHDSEVYFNQLQEHPLMNYQVVGMCGLYSLALIFSQKKIKLGDLLYFLPVCLYVILTSGARQAMFGVVIVILLKVFFLADLSRTNKWIAVALSILFLTAYFGILSNEKISSAAKVLSADGGGMMTNGARGINFYAAFLCIRDHPIVGAGLGGYERYIDWQGDQFGKWPHNIFLEILSEMGIVGLAAIVVLLIAFLSRYKVSFRLLTRGNLYYFLLPVAMFCRFLASSDLGDSVVLFSAVFALSGFLPEKKRRRHKFVFRIKKKQDHEEHENDR